MTDVAHWGVDTWNRRIISDATLGLGNYTTLVKKWTKTDAAEIQGGIIKVGSYIHYGDLAGYLHARAVSDGTERSGFPVSLGGAIYGTPTHDSGSLYVCTYDGKIHKRSATDGTSAGGNWPVTLSGPASSTPRISGGKVLVGDGGGFFRGLNTDGSAGWLSSMFTDFYGDPVIFDTECIPVIYGSNVVFGAGRNVVSRAVSDGSNPHLNYPCREDALVTTPVSLGTFASIDYLFFGSSDHWAYAYRAADTTPIWQWLGPGDFKPGFPVSEADLRIVMGLSNWRVTAHFAKTGGINWLRDGTDSGPILTTAFIVNTTGFGSAGGGTRIVYDVWPLKAPGVGGDGDGRLAAWLLVSDQGGQVPPWKDPSLSRHDGGNGKYNSGDPLVVDAQLYCGDDFGKMNCYGLP